MNQCPQAVPIISKIEICGKGEYSENKFIADYQRGYCPEGSVIMHKSDGNFEVLDLSEWKVEIRENTIEFSNGANPVLSYTLTYSV